MKQLIETAPLAAFISVYLIAKHGYGAEAPLHYAAIAMTIAYALQIALSWFLWQKLEKMHLAIFIMLVISVSLTIFFNNSAFLIWKFTIVYWIFTTIILGAYYAKGLNLTQRTLEAAFDNVPDFNLNVPHSAWNRVNLSTALFFFAIGGLNLIIGYGFSESTWVLFKVVGSLGFTLVGLIVLMSYLSQFKE